MVRFQDLPVEIILEILEETFWVGDRVSLSRCCKLLHKLTEPLIYDRIPLDIQVGRYDPVFQGHTWRYLTRIRTSNRVPPIHLLLRSILERPALADSINCITVKGVLPESLWDYYDPLSTVEMGIVTNLIHSMKAPFPNVWVRELWKGNPEVFIALLTSQCHKVRAFEIANDFVRDIPLTAEMFHHLIFDAQTPTSFSKFHSLEVVSLYSGDIDDRFTPGQHPPYLTKTIFGAFMACLALPSIETICVSLPHWDEPIPRPNERNFTSNLTMLVLYRTMLPPLLLKEILCATPKLKSLYYDYRCSLCPIDSHLSNDYSLLFECSELLEALKEVRTTLQYLMIAFEFTDVRGSGDIIEGPFGTRGLLGSLRRFAKLSSLEIPWCLLFGEEVTLPMPRLEDALPASLEFFRIRNDWPYMTSDEEILQDQWTSGHLLSCISRYFEDWKQPTPNLHSLSLMERAAREMCDWSQRDQREFTTMCLRAGIRPEFVQK